MREIRRDGALAVLLLTGVLACRPGLSAQPAASFSGDFDPARALTAVYGSLSWTDPRLQAFTDFPQGRAFVAPAFDAAFTEQGVEKHIVIATLTPRPPASFNCNACSPLLGGAVFRKEGGSWRVESVGQIIGPGQARSSLALVRIGPDRYGVLHESSWVSGGYEARTAGYLFAMGGTLASRLLVRTPQSGESPGPGACGFPSAQALKLTMDGAASGAYYDAIAEERWNEGTCAEVTLPDGRRAGQWSGSACTRVARYRMREDHYELLSTEREACGAPGRGTVNWEG